MSPDQPQTIGFSIRGVGCGGTQEVTGQGLLAAGRGTICMNGQFDLSTPNYATFLTVLAPFANGTATAMDLNALLQFLASGVFKGESNCAITLHVPN